MQETSGQETRNKNTSGQEINKQYTRIQGTISKNTSRQAEDKKDVSKPDAGKRDVKVMEAAPEKPDFKLLLHALSEAEDNYLFFTNAKILLTAVLQHTFAATAQEEKNILLLLENKNAILAAEVKKIYACCNQYLYSPVIDENARTALIARLDAVIKQAETA